LFEFLKSCGKKEGEEEEEGNLRLSMTEIDPKFPVHKPRYAQTGHLTTSISSRKNRTYFVHAALFLDEKAVNKSSLRYFFARALMPF
jgi:hypothetical protein